MNGDTLYKIISTIVIAALAIWFGVEMLASQDTSERAKEKIYNKESLKNDSSLNSVKEILGGDSGTGVDIDIIK